MHIVAKRRSISSKNINYETHNYFHEGASGARNVLESAGFVYRGQNLASKTKQPFYRGTRQKCCIILQKQLLYHRISFKTMNVFGSVSQEHVNFCSSICVFWGLCFKTQEVIFLTGTLTDVVGILMWLLSVAVQRWHIRTVSYGLQLSELQN